MYYCQYVLICSRTKSINYCLLTVSVSYLSKNCTTCLFISKSFKELFFMAFFEKADAKVRTIFITTKLFRRNFQKKFFLSDFEDPTSLSVFQSLPHLSRLRVQNYCFKTYLPNTSTTFLSFFCNFYANSLIIKICCRT